MNEVGITSKKGRHALNDARSVDGTALEVLHDVKELVVHIWMICKLDFHLIKITQRVL